MSCCEDGERGLEARGRGHRSRRDEGAREIREFSNFVVERKETTNYYNRLQVEVSLFGQDERRISHETGRSVEG